MATTHVPPLRPLKSDVDLQAFIEKTHELLRVAQGDEDKSGSIDDAAYYEGCVWGLKWALDQLTVPAEDKKE